MDNPSARRPRRPHSYAAPTLALLAACAIISLFSGYLSTSSVASWTSPVPLNAPELVYKCKALSAKPEPPPTFHQRPASDRFQPGTRPIHVRNATLWTGRVQGLEVVHGDLLLDRGLIKAVGHVTQEQLDALEDVIALDAHGAWVTPGVIDLHSHLAVGSSPALAGSKDVNSLHGLVLPWLRSLDALNTHDEGFKLAIAGGVTTSLILPGSADAIGGQAFVIKLRPTNERTPSAMLLEPPLGYNGSEDPNLPPRWRHMKHACGENPSEVYSGTRMDTTWAYRQAYNKAREIKNAQDTFCSEALSGNWKAIAGQSFPEDLQWEALVDILRGKVKVQTHCYEAVDFDYFVRLSNEYQFPVAAFHHAHEAYLVPDLLKQAYEHPPAVAIFGTFSRYKREAFRHSEYAPRVLADNDIQVVMKSDHPGIVSRFLIHEAAQAHYYGLPDNVALASVISTPAVVLGLDHRIGFLKEGYDADIVLWDSHPLSIGATPIQTIIDGIPQVSSPYAIEKPSSLQRAPQTPDFMSETADTLEHDGLPPLGATQSTTGIVIFTNVSNVWVQDGVGRGIVELHDSGETPGDRVVVVDHGKVVCSNAWVLCSPFVFQADAATINLKGGALQPGLISFGSSMGLQEISMEPSTTDGVAYDPLVAEVPAVAGGDGYLAKAIDGLQFGTRDALLAYRHGVTVSVTAPIYASFLGGLSVAFSLGSPHKLEKGAIIQDVVALHVSLQQGDIPSVSTQVAALRKELLDPVDGESRQWFGKVTNGAIPLVAHAHSADIIATLISLKREVEAETGIPLKMTIVGAAEAHILAKELGAAHIGVILSPPRSYPYQWDERRSLPGPPLTSETAAARLIKHGVTVGLGPQGVSGDPQMSAWAVRNSRFDTAWTYLNAPDVLTKEAAFALASTNIGDLLGLEITPGEEDLVATSGGDLLGFEGKVTAVISPRRGKVDLF